MDNIKKVQNSGKMSEVSEVVSNRDRARLRLKESIMELAAARGKEDDVIDKLIAKVNEVFNALVDSHVELVLGLGENLRDETHENFLYEASDERDEAVEEAEKEKVKAEESIKVNNLGLMGKKDREEFFDEKLEISRKASQEVDLRNARPDASLQRGEVPHEVSRVLNRTSSMKQKLPSIPEEIFDGELGLIVKSEFIKKGIGYGNLLERPVFIARSSKDSQFIYDTGKLARYDAWDAKHPTQQNNEFIEKGLIQATVNESMEQQFGGLLHIRDLAKLKLSGAAFIKRCFGSIIHIAQVDKEGIRIMREGGVVNTPSSIEFYDPGEELFGKLFYMEKPSNEAAEDVYEHVKQTFGVSRVTGDTAEEADCEAIKEEINAREFTSKEGVEKTAEVAEENVKEKSPVKFAGTSHAHGLPRSVEFYDPGEELFGDMPQSKGLARLNITFNDRDPARFKLSGPDCVKRRSRSIRLDNKSAMAGQLGYDNGKLAKYGVWGTKYLTQQECVSFKMEQQFGDLEQARDLAKLKLSGTVYVERSAGSIVLITKCGFDEKGVGDSNLLDQYNYIVGSYEVTGPLIKYNRFKVSGAVCLEEKHRAFNREEFNILLKHTIDKLKFSGTAYAKIFSGGFGLFAKPVHTGKVGRLKDIDPRFQRRLKDFYPRLQKKEYVRKYSSSIGLIVKSEFIKKRNGYGNLLEQPVFVARSSKDTGSVIKDNRLKEKYKDTDLIGEENSQK